MREIMTRQEAADDHSLMAAIAARDPSALGALYDRHASVLLALCVRVLRDRMEAEEVLGDVFLEVWNRYDRYRPSRGNPLTYLLTVARSRAVDRLRSRRQRDRLTVAAEDVAGLEDLRPQAPRPSPLGEAVVAEQRSRVLHALDELAARERHALELSFFDGLSHQEISRHLGEPLGTVKTRIRQGLIRLRKSLRTQYDAGA